MKRTLVIGSILVTLGGAAPSYAAGPAAQGSEEGCEALLAATVRVAAISLEQGRLIPAVQKLRDAAARNCVESNRRGTFACARPEPWGAVRGSHDG
jgi:hypothetical protein